MFSFLAGLIRDDEIRRAIEKRYWTIFDTTGAATLIIEEDKTISQANSDYEKISGYSKYETEGKKKWTEFIPNGYLTIMEGHHRLRRIDPNSAPRNYEAQFINRQGQTRDIMLTVNMIPGTKRSVVSFLDITKQKRAERALRDHSLFLQRMIDNIPNPIFYKDSAGLYQGCNKAVEKFLGKTKEEIIGKSVYDIFPRDLADKYYEMDSALFREPGVQIYEHSLLYADGTKHDVIFNKATCANNDGTLAGLVGTIVDITDRKKAEEALKLLNQRFSQIFNNSPSLMFISTVQEGRFVMVNNRFLQVTGYSREEIIGRTVTDISFWARPDRAEVIKLLLENGMVNNLECIFREKSGEANIGLYSAQIIPFDDEQLVLSVVNDISERKRLEEEMSRLERLNLIGEMAAGIGHEIRNPMTTIRGFLQMLGEKQECGKFREYFNLMIEELDRANSIISEYLSLAKNKTVSRRYHNLNHILKTLHPLIQADAMRKDMYAHMELGDIPDLLLDEKEIRQLILNMVRNGLEAMIPGGKINLKTFMEGDKVVLIIQDQGAGIEPDVLKKMGTPFFTTKDSGTGLGLAVCYSIALRQNASIRVETGPTGTIFYVDFSVS